MSTVTTVGKSELGVVDLTGISDIRIGDFNAVLLEYSTTADQITLRSSSGSVNYAVSNGTLFIGPTPRATRSFMNGFVFGHNRAANIDVRVSVPWSAGLGVTLENCPGNNLIQPSTKL